MNEGDALAIVDRSRVRRELAGGDAHQRRLSGAVLADDGQDLAAKCWAAIGTLVGALYFKPPAEG